MIIKNFSRSALASKGLSGVPKKAVERLEISCPFLSLIRTMLVMSDLWSGAAMVFITILEESDMIFSSLTAESSKERGSTGFLNMLSATQKGTLY